MKYSNYYLNAHRPELVHVRSNQAPLLEAPDHIRAHPQVPNVQVRSGHLSRLRGDAQQRVRDRSHVGPASPRLPREADHVFSELPRRQEREVKVVLLYKS